MRHKRCQASQLPGSRLRGSRLPGARLRWSLLLATLWWPASALTADDDWSVAGFGSLSVATLDTAQFDYVSQRALQAEGAGRSAEWSYKPDTVLGGQLDYPFTESLTGTGQLTVRQDHQGDMAPDLTLALLRWEFADDWSARVGRMQNPQFLYSESWLTQFGAPHARPRMEVYIAFPLPGFDGALLSRGFDWAGWRGQWQLGWSHTTGVDTRQFDDSELLGPTAALSLQRTPWRLQLAYADFQLNLGRSQTFDPPLAQIRTLDPSIADAFDNQGVDWHVASLGIEYDDGRWHGVLEAVQRRNDSVLAPDLAGQYLTLERRFSDTTAYLSLFHVDTASIAGRYRNSPAFPVITSLAAITEFGQRGYALGGTFPLTEQIRVRLQWDRFHVDARSYGLFINYQPGFDVSEERDVNLYTVSLDFLF